MHDRLAERFEAHRPALRAVAYRMLGSPGETDDAVQEAWLRLTRHGPAGIDDLKAWLRTVVARICLDMLRARTSRREEPYGWHSPVQTGDGDPETEAVLIESVGRAMLVVLDALGPAERVAFVLHDVFAVPFDQIAPIVERTPATAKKLASRARRRVRGADRTALTPGRPAVLRGAGPVAREMQLFGRRARYAGPALIGGTVGAVVAPHGRLLLALAVTVHDGRVTGYEMIADPARLTALHITVP
ncbi:sigma-70 family RNA polymerase sigma factor [Actinomadura luteofluorescens]|uniref:RNA polymerase sigma-70 factor (ECF subfamily) n=1 Tax=Actinomadura luteofluorescens TaxID=46163 RepID=A0A7Y9ERS0_9ACTN|nr:sigma-70 family RNA polymerase sigma factor [Actinomadura luteofluorescens]NYD52753.1 RNA polymerase sigma-70 factor (ECF subfamily) [Actinomadura luteofluorescens]